MLYQLPDMEGKWGSLMSDLAGGVIGWTGKFTGLMRIHLAEFSQLERKFVLLGADEEAVGAFFDPDRVRIFSSLDSTLALNASGDSFEVSILNAHRKSADEMLEMEIAAALKLMQSLGS